ncbi:formate/nitrite transporter family protein [Cardiobacteriaceae bacterium TAE3-ERU3]|nr:formate/nitrite transporter family protein [Cardiobacteriaceae bacterium TAE3-ERU3]
MSDSKERREAVKQKIHEEGSEVTEPKTHGEILIEQILHAQDTFDRSTRGLFTSALTAGLEIGFSYLLLMLAFHVANTFLPAEWAFRASGLFYPVGFIIVVIGQALLFTEQTSLLTLPVLNKLRSVGSLLKLWGIVIAGNLIGGWLFAIGALWLAPQMDWFSHQEMATLAKHATDIPPLVLFTSAVLAGWLMGLLSWLVTSAKDTISRIVLVFIITSGIGFLGLHHSIVGNVEVAAGLLAGDSIGWSDYFIFLALALGGNACGGAFFVAALKYRAFMAGLNQSD